MKNPLPARRTGEHFHSDKVKLQTENRNTRILFAADNPSGGGRVCVPLSRLWKSE